MKFNPIKKILHKKPIKKRTLAVEADLTAAYLYGFEKGKDAIRTDLAHQKKLVRMLAIHSLPEKTGGYLPCRIEEVIACAEAKVADQEKEERYIAWAEAKVKEQEKEERK